MIINAKYSTYFLMVLSDRSKGHMLKQYSIHTTRRHVRSSKLGNGSRQLGVHSPIWVDSREVHVVDVA